MLTNACSLMSIGMVKFTSLLVNAGSEVGFRLESELGQKWRYGALKLYIYIYVYVYIYIYVCLC